MDQKLDNFEFNCPQFVDFVNVVGNENTSSNSSSFFDKHADTECLQNIAVVEPIPSNSTCVFQPIPTHSEKELDKRPDGWQKFKARLTSTPAPNSVPVPLFHQGLTISKKNVQKVDKASVKHPVTKSNAVREERVKAVPRRRLGITQQPTTSVAAAAVVSKPAMRFGPTKSNPIAKATKRKSHSPPPKPNKRAKLTQPKTPECLKRSMAKKVLKSSEEMEMEKIAVLQKQTADHVRQNRINMRKMIRPSKAFTNIEDMKSHKHPKIVVTLVDKTLASQTSKIIDGFKVPLPKEEKVPAKLEVSQSSNTMPYPLRNRSKSASASETLLDMSNISNKSKNLPVHCGLKVVMKQPNRSASKSFNSKNLGKENQSSIVEPPLELEIEKKAQKNVAVWKKTIEEELDNQKKSILKRSKLVKKSKASKNRLP